MPGLGTPSRPRLTQWSTASCTIISSSMPMMGCSMLFARTSYTIDLIDLSPVVMVIFNALPGAGGCGRCRRWLTTGEEGDRQDREDDQ
jgi:hypothetical protein